MSTHNIQFSGGIIYFLSFSYMKVCCVFSLELPHRGDSNEYTQHTIFHIKQKPTQNDLEKVSVAMGFFVRDSRTSSK